MAKNESTTTTVDESDASDAIQRSAYASAGDRLDAEEKYLRDNGWEMSGEYDRTGKHMWFDPDGAGPKTAVPGPIHELPQRGGGFETVRQMQVPPASWRHPHDRAVYMQGLRDKAEGKHESVQDKLNRLGAMLDGSAEVIRPLIHEIERLCKRQVPDKPDNVRAELLNMKTTLFTALRTCKDKLDKVLATRPVE